MISYSVPEMSSDLDISAAAIDPDRFRVCCGTQMPASLLYDFESDLPILSCYNYSKEVTAVTFL